MKFAIVDDTKQDALLLASHIQDYFSKRQLFCEILHFSSAAQFLGTYHAGEFTAIFLDIVMIRTTGMELAHTLRAQADNVPIIFVSTEESYSLEGYSVQATDYLLKPVNAARLAKTLDLLVKRSQPEPYIQLKEKRMTYCLMLSKLLFIRALGHYLEIHTTDETFSIYMSLSSITEMLEQADAASTPTRKSRFINCCRGYLVNLEHIRSLNSDSIQLKDGSSVPISRSRIKETQEAYADYLFAQTRELL